MHIWVETMTWITGLNEILVRRKRFCCTKRMYLSQSLFVKKGTERYCRHSMKESEQADRSHTREEAATISRRPAGLRLRREQHSHAAISLQQNCAIHYVTWRQRQQTVHVLQTIINLSALNWKTNHNHSTEISKSHDISFFLRKWLAKK